MTDDEFNDLPKSIGNWVKNTKHRMYENGYICASIGKEVISFGGYRPVGFNIGKAKYSSPQDVIDILSKATGSTSIKSLCDC